MTISLSIISIIVSIISSEIDFRHNLIANRKVWNDRYDYIVVGAGSAGAVVSHRLAENPNIKVLLLEAGGPASVGTDIPGDFVINLASRFDWNYTTVRQNNFGLATNGIIFQSRGKVIGGSSTLNAMAYNRGNKRDFDNWSENFGAKGWSYEEVLPYFIKSERNSDLSLVSENQGFHGTNGLLSVSSSPNPQPIFNSMLKAFNELGLKTTDLNGGQQLGTAIAQLTINNNTSLRSSTGNAYIDPNPYPNNLYILTNAFVTKVLFNTSNPQLKAIGVQFIRNNKTYEVRAEKEIIISGGTFNSPQLLMLSGIGPKYHLKELNIEVIADLPVGDSLQDQPTESIFIPLKPNVPSNPFPVTNDTKQLFDLLVGHSGPLSRLDQLYALYTTPSNSIKQWPNAGIAVFANQILPETALSFTNLTDEWIEYYKPYVGRNSLQIGVYLGRYRSTGTLRLVSTNPFVHPLIDPSYLSNPQDFEDAVDSVKFAFNALTNTSLSNSLDLIPEPIPGCQLCPNQSIYECDSYIRCFITQLVTTVFHPVGTCRMGAINRPDVVVDERLRVKSVTGLRVCDASVMPQSTNANTNAPTIMIGEKCADMIKQDNKY